MSALYVPGDHESALGRDVVLAPPTCCCCCCCCTLVAPEIFVGRQFARETGEALWKTSTPETFWDTQLPFAAGVLLLNLIVSPIAGILGAALLLVTMGIYGVAILAGLAAGIIINTTRLGARVDRAMGGLLWGLALCAIVAAQMVAEVALVVIVGEGLDEFPAIALALFAFAITIPIIVLGMAKRREARQAAEEVLPDAPPPL